MSNPVYLNCLIYGGVLTKYSEVEIDNGKSYSALKEKIVHMNLNTFASIDPLDIELYRESIPTLNDGIGQKPELKPENHLFVGKIQTKLPESLLLETDVHVIVVKPRK